MNPAWLLDTIDLQNLQRGIGLTFSLGGQTVTLLYARTRPLGAPSDNGHLALPPRPGPRPSPQRLRQKPYSAAQKAAWAVNAAKARAAKAKQQRERRRAEGSRA